MQLGVIEPGGASPAAWKVPTSPGVMLPRVQLTAARPSTVNPPLAGGGGGRGDVTVTFAWSQMVVVAMHAWTLFGNEPTVLPAVKKPVAATMVPGGLVVDQTGVTVRMLPPASLTTALNCAVAPVASVVSGATTLDAAGPAITVTFA